MRPPTMALQMHESALVQEAEFHQMDGLLCELRGLTNESMLPLSEQRLAEQERDCVKHLLHPEGGHSV